MKFRPLIWKESSSSFNETFHHIEGSMPVTAIVASGNATYLDSLVERQKPDIVLSASDVKTKAPFLRVESDDIMEALKANSKVKTTVKAEPTNFINKSITRDNTIWNGIMVALGTRRNKKPGSFNKASKIYMFNTLKKEEVDFKKHLSEQYKLLTDGEVPKVRRNFNMDLDKLNIKNI